jgi:hypothetical protein
VPLSSLTSAAAAPGMADDACNDRSASVQSRTAPEMTGSLRNTPSFVLFRERFLDVCPEPVSVNP